MAARLANLALDCDDVLKVAQFWSETLGRPLDGGAGPEFASIGGADPTRAEAAWYFNRVPETKRTKNRVHIDLVDPDPGAVEALVSRGATVAGRHRLSAGGHQWTVLQDPEGNEFCIAAAAFTGWD